jgi:hypothetical protein
MPDIDPRRRFVLASVDEEQFVTATGQRLDQRPADELRSTEYEDSHALILPASSR